ncbi:MAG: PAS domain S-box protein [Bacteroidales bacterium]|nr:PAS domain S-box protein [Bacteroidales bacterium]
MKTKMIIIPLKYLMLTGVFICFFQWMNAFGITIESGLSNHSPLLFQEVSEFSETEVTAEVTDTAPLSLGVEETVQEDLTATKEDHDIEEDGIDSLKLDTKVGKGMAERKRLPFYKMWWFSLLVIILLSIPIISRYNNKNKQLLNSSLEDCKQKISGLEEQLKEKEDYYKKLQEEQSDRAEAEKELRFQADGIAKFSDLIAKNKSNTATLGQTIISELVEFIGANSGAIYLIKEEDGEEPRLEFFGGFAPDIDQIKTTFKIGEGYIGTCYKEGTTMELADINQTFLKVYSGLGQASPGHLVFVPLKQDENNMGVIEIASFKKIDTYKIRFLEKLSENIASSLAINQANEKMQVLLEQSKVQARELQTREEELRQNLEEMHATQEDLNRQMEANKIMQQNLIKEKALLDSLMNSLPDYIYFKDLDSKFIRISKSMHPIFPVENIEDMLGKSDFDFIEKETAKNYYEEEQEIIKTGKGFVDKVVHEVFENGHEQWSSITKMPLIDESGKCIGTYGITKDINHIKKLELEAREKAEMLLSQEEELRQNLEEMQATQEDLQRQMAENKKIQEDLAREMSLMDALMESVPDYIYFKDLDSKFIKNSKSHAILFGFENPKDIAGKSDFDFFADEHARPAYEGEQKIIKTGKSIINLVEKEVKKDGSVSWVSTSKMPLRDHTGKIIGTFGISKDITDIKKMEMEIKERNEELQAQEEELRQNLEEMHTTQEDLERQMEENKKIQEDLAKEKYLMDALMDNVPDYIYFKDLNSKFIRNSKSHAKLFGFEDPREITGKSDFDFFAEEHAKPAFEGEQKIIRTGNAIVNLVEKEVKKDGTESWVSTSKMPLKDQNGKIVGTFGISKDITPLKKMEFEILEKNEVLLAQEEELRQNLEEMHATQEDLERQLEENQKTQEELAREKILMDALMDNVPEYIYFKDRDSKFIRNSKSHARLFGFENPKDISGKSDFDFFADEHARPAYEGEQKIIKTGKPILDLVEREVKKDGSISWVSTTKLPLRDQKGKIVGTFGISKDITESKKMEMEIKEKNEELLSQEEELRQNLEEMQTIQEDLKRRLDENEKMKKEFHEKEKTLKDTINKLQQELKQKKK